MSKNMTSVDATDLMDQIKNYICGLPDNSIFMALCMANFNSNEAISGELYGGRHLIIGLAIKEKGTLLTWAAMTSIGYNGDGSLSLAYIRAGEWAARFKRLAFQS